MSTVTIKDGTGTGNQVFVDTSGHLHTRSTIETIRNEAALVGDAFFVGSGTVTLTGDGRSTVLFMKNLEDRSLIIDRIQFSGQRPSGTDIKYYFIGFYQDATGITGGTGNEISQVNINLGSRKVLDLTSETGKQGATNDGVLKANIMAVAEQRDILNSSIVIPPNQTLALDVQPPSGSNSFRVAISLNVNIERVETT